MIFIGITGSFAAGKSLILNYLSNKGYKTFSADEFIKNLYKNKEIQKKVLEILPTLKTFNKQKIAQIIYNDEKERLNLQNFIHLYVSIGLEIFKKKHSIENMIFAEIPLLFEAKFEKYFDYIITSYCAEETRLKRAKERMDFDPELFNKIKKVQMSQREKIKKSGFIVKTDVKMLELEVQLINILERLQCQLSVKLY